MQEPTCIHMRIRNPSDAHVVFHAVSLRLRPMVSRRLDTDEKRYIQSGCVFVWEERGPNTETSGIGIERWTDSIRWGPSRVRDEFLFYNERETTTDLPQESHHTPRSSLRSQTRGQHRAGLVKQTYSAFVDTERGRRKWHLIAYFTQETLNCLHTVDDFPDLSRISVPPGRYRTARASGARGTGRGQDIEQHPIVSPEQYHFYPLNYGHSRPNVPYIPGSIPPASDNGLLAPLEYLKAIPPPRRHPLDEEALMSFGKKLAGWVH